MLLLFLLYRLSRYMRFSVLGEFFGGFAVLDDFIFGFAVSNTPQCPPHKRVGVLQNGRDLHTVIKRMHVFVTLHVNNIIITKLVNIHTVLEV